MSDRAYGVVVVGGGVVGLAAAWHLLRLGCRPLAVVERFRVGHTNGSSHGSVRITRSTYSTSARRWSTEAMSSSSVPITPRSEATRRPFAPPVPTWSALLHR